MKQFLFARNNDRTIGADGIGAVDFPSFDEGSATIGFRKGVRPFNALCEYRENLVVFSETFFSHHIKELRPAIVSERRCVGTLSGKPRYFVSGRLLYHEAVETLDWSNSSFDAVDGSEFQINMTRISRGERPRDSVVEPVARGLRFPGLQQFMEERMRGRLWLIPRELSVINARSVELLSFRASLVLCSVRLAEAISSGKDAGMEFGGPLVSVHFRS